jgi:hypothetical protein
VSPKPSFSLRQLTTIQPNPHSSGEEIGSKLTATTIAATTLDGNAF